MQNGTHTRELYDAAVIGAGYAGVTAAITLARALHTVLVFDDDRPVNRWNTAIHHMPTWEGKRADVTRRECKSDLQAPGVRLVEQTVTHVDSKSDGSFVLTDASGSTYAVRKLLLACGVEHELPALEGYDACFTRGILPCMFQFGYEQRSARTAGVLAIDIISIPQFTKMLSDDGHKFSEELTVYTHGNAGLEKELVAYCADEGVRVDTRKIVRMRLGEASDATGHTGSEIELEFEDGTTKSEGFLVHRPGTKLTCPLVEQLGLKISDHGNVEVTPPFLHTSHPGVFAAGDCASPMKIIANAMATGVYAANGVARELPKRVTKKGP